MDNERYIKLIHSDREIADISIDDISALVKMTRPVWEQIREKSVGDAPGPSYVSQISLPGNITLDLILTRYSQWMVGSEGQDGHYEPKLWQLVVAEGESLRVNYFDDEKGPGRVRNLFERVEERYEHQVYCLSFPTLEPSAERTRKILREYLQE